METGYLNRVTLRLTGNRVIGSGTEAHSKAHSLDRLRNPVKIFSRKKRCILQPSQGLLEWVNSSRRDDSSSACSSCSGQDSFPPSCNSSVPPSPDTGREIFGFLFIHFVFLFDFKSTIEESKNLHFDVRSTTADHGRGRRHAGLVVSLPTTGSYATLQGPRRHR